VDRKASGGSKHATVCIALRYDGQSTIRPITGARSAAREGRTSQSDLTRAGRNGTTYLSQVSRLIKSGDAPPGPRYHEGTHSFPRCPSPWPESHSKSPSRSIRPRCRRNRHRAPSVRCTARGCRRGQRCHPPSRRHLQAWPRRRRRPRVRQRHRTGPTTVVASLPPLPRDAGSRHRRTRVARLRRRRIRAAGSLHMRKRRRDGVPRPATLRHPVLQMAPRRTFGPARSGPTARRQSPPAAGHPNPSTARGARPPIARSRAPRLRRQCMRTSAKV